MPYPQKSLVTLCLFFVFNGFLSVLSAQSAESRTFSFVLKSTAKTSAGVYKKDGTLVRTLWSGVQYNAGRQLEKWDGLDDEGKAVENIEYDIKVLSGNVNYEWEGARIGNTSNKDVGSTKLRLFEPVRGIAIANNRAYFAGGYNEGWPSQFRVDISNPNSKTWIGKMKSTDQASDYVATDGKYVYWGGYDPLETRSLPETFVFATQVNNDAEVKFDYGTPASMLWGKVYPSTISYIKQANSIITGLAVQKNGNYLFVARSGLNQLQVLNKNTGALISTLTYSQARKCIVDQQDNLWLAHGSVVEKFAVSSLGTLTSTGVKILNAYTAALSVSPDNNTIILADINTQQVKGYSNTNGSILWTLGNPGGYLADATVTDNKFYWKDVRKELLTFLTYLPDGSFYVGDVGNLRTQRYSANRTFLDRIMFLQNVYNTSVDKKNPKRVFSDFLEFEVDYSKPLGVDNGSWKLVKNWGANFGAQYDEFNKILNIITLKNGKTYGLMRIRDQYFLIELVQGGVIRYTGIEFKQRTFLDEDGSQINNPGTVLGVTCTLLKYPLIGFDAQNNPVWSKIPELLSTTPPVRPTDPVPWEGFRGDFATASNNIIYFDYTKADDGHSTGYHLGAIKKGTNKWLWRTAKSTDVNYRGPFPPDGTFDNGNGVVAHGAGGPALITGDNIFWGYHGEFWKQSQTNKWNHVDGNTGLFVGQFGVLTSDYPNEEAFAGGAGNVLNGTLVEVDGITYLYHNDESVHAGVHRWKITGLNTIEVQTATTTNEQIFAEGIDLLQGLNRGTILSNDKGWDRGNDPDEFSINKWNIVTGVKTYNMFTAPDINIIFSVKDGKRALSRDLGNNFNLNAWKLVGKMNFENSAPTEARFMGTAFMEVVDKKDKVIARFDFRQDLVSGQRIMGNDKTLLHGTDYELDKLKNHTQPIEISAKDGVITFSYANLTPVNTTTKVDINATWQEPKYLRFSFANQVGSNDYLKYFNISEMRFVTNPKTADQIRAELTNCVGKGGINWEYWNNVSTGSMGNIPVNKTPDGSRILTSLSTPGNFADKFGSRMRGYICPPQSGDYVFYVSGDDMGELWLSKNENPAQKEKIAFFNEWTTVGNYTKYASQKSAAIYLTAGQKYYVEALLIDNFSADNLSVAWTKPDGETESPIPGSSLIPFSFVQDVNTLPVVAITSPTQNAEYTVGETATINANASDADGSITKVEFYAGTTKIGEDITAPYSINWATTTTGTFSFTAKAFDNKAATNTSAIVGVNVVAANKLPVVSITSPVDRTEINVGQVASVNVSATDADGSITKVEFYVGSTKIGEDVTTPYSINWTPTTTGTFSITAKATDNKAASATTAKVDVIVNKLPLVNIPATQQALAVCTGLGTINWDLWYNVPLDNLSKIPVNTNANESKELTEFTTPINFGEYFGARVRGYVCPPQTGLYTFFVSGDDMGALWLSENDDPAKKAKIAWFDGWTSVRQNDKYPTQKSVSILLKAGQKYYIEALQIEAYGGDHLSVSWILPDGKLQSPIPGANLAPFTPAKIPNVAPEVSLTSPTANSAFNLLTDVLINAKASDKDGTIALVEFFVNDAKIGQTANAPYNFTFKPTVAGDYMVSVKATDNTGNVSVSSKVSIKINQPEPESCEGKGGLTWQYWTNVPFAGLGSIPVSQPVSGSRVLSEFSTPVNFADNFGSRFIGYLCAPQTGNYYFYICGDDKGELWLSTNALPANKQKIAFFEEWTGYRQYSKYSSQKSKAIYLTKGQKYYIEALHLDNSGPDQLSVACYLPNGTLQNPIQGSILIPYDGTVSNTALKARPSAPPASTTVEASSNSKTASRLDVKTYPNPFVNTLNIECSIAEGDQYTLQIFNMQGILLKTVFSGNLTAGKSKFVLNASTLKNGTYICRLSSARGVVNKQVTLIR